MSLQSTNGNQNIVMIPTNDDDDDKTDGNATSSSTVKSEPMKSSIILISGNISLKEGNEMESEMESKLINDDDNMTAIEASESHITTTKSNKKIDNRSMGIPKVRVKTLPKRNWRNSHARMLLNHHKNKNGCKRACQKNVKMQYKRLAAIMANKSGNKVENFDQNEQNSEHKLPELCPTSTDCTSCKETFLDKLELHKHTTLAHPDVSIKFCHLCDDTFLDGVELQSHTLTIHGQSSETVQQNDLEQLNILNELERIEECSSGNIPENAQVTNQLVDESGSQMTVNIDQEKMPTETLEFIEEATIEPMKSFPYAVKVEIADRDSDIYSYTALEEKKEYCSKDYEDCRGMNETSMVKCEWSSPKQNDSNENTQDSISINNEVHIENCLTSSMEEFQDIEELETSCEVDYMEKVQHIDQIIGNGNFTCNEDKHQLISDVSKRPVCESIELIKNEQNEETSNQELIRILSDDLDIISSPKNPSSSICRTYSSKINSQISRKPPPKIYNIEDEEINFCIMCREIFSLIEQKSIKTNPDAESIFKCPLCSCQFALRSSLEKHVAYHHLNCECTKVAVSSTSIALEASVSPELYECVLCPTVFNDYDGLNNHILSLHEPMPPFKDRLTIGKPEYLRTVRCSYMESKMSMTKNRNNTALIIKIKCPNCESTFLTCDDYLLHVKELHSDPTTIENNSWPSMGTARSIENLTSEILMDINTEKDIEMNESEIKDSIEKIGDLGATENCNELQKSCNRCNKEFETVRELSEHLYFSHDDSLESQAIMAAASSIDKENYDWCCIHCSQRFKLLKSYIRHRYFVHNDESMVHVCDNCSKILTSITMVNVHVCLNVSSWECKPCNLSFENGVELRIHNTAEHTEIPGPYICSMCQKRFLTMSMLRRHQQSKKCYPHVRPPEKSKIGNPSNQHGVIKKGRTTAKKAKAQSERKVKKEYPHLQDLSHMRVIQEDVFVRDAKDRNGLQNMNNHSSSTSLKSEPNDEIYQCSMCKLYFLSKAGLKVHLSRAHTSAVEICQLCYKMFVTGNLVRHITDNHLKHDNNNQSYYKAMRVKLHNTFDIDEHDIERDTEELIATIGTNQLLGLCEYQRFTEQSDDNDRFCPDCPLTFDNSEKYRRHYVQTHDKLCALCHMEFETGQDAARHKTRIHGSMACYVWFAHKLIAAISDTKTFSEMAEKIIINTIPTERSDECKMEIEGSYGDENFVNELSMVEAEGAELIFGTSDKSDEWSNINGWGESNPLTKNSLKEEPNSLVDPNHIENQVDVGDHDDVDYNDDDVNDNKDDNDDNDNKDDDDNGDEDNADVNNDGDGDDDDDDDLDDYKLFILVTEDDLEKYKNNVAELAQQIYSTCNLFSINQIEKMLEPYAKE